MTYLDNRHTTAQAINTGNTVFSSMTLFEVVLRVSSNDGFVNLSRRFPSAKIFIWCNRENDVVEVIVRDPEEYPLVMEEMRAWGCEIVEDSLSDRRLYLVVQECHCMNQDTIVRHIGKLDILNIFPNFIENGWSYHRLIVFRHADLEELLRRLEKWGWFYKILRKVPFDGFIASSLTLTADALFSELTEKQIDALLTAYRHGYYNLPRDADVQTIALKEKVPRTTFQEHLKKAENKVVRGLVPYMELFNHASPERRRSLKVK
ncbi:MAG: helix-turn-helix domain-containing protein [Candidatus Bathyarchaeota archaeon]|jgi:predicted DNA binding protein|nr:helix-turn-helix domain-containing protein [Candidatus Bathyarchaeota archaeon]